MGHSGAQLECGIHAWRARRGAEDNDVRAVFWLQKAAAQGSVEAQQALERISPVQPPAGWADPLLPLLTREVLSSQPLLAARIELAALFRLTRAEALLLDVKAADQGHCLVVDIRASYGRSKRRLVLVRTAAERHKLDRIVRLFEQVDPDLEGNYRQRLYRLKSWLGADMMAAA
jgi:TPR repeat protein